MLHAACLNLWRHRRRTLFTGMVCSAAMTAVLLGAGFALFTYQSLAEKAARDLGHLTLSHPEYFLDNEDVPLQHGIQRDPALEKRLLARDDVKAVLPRLQFSGLVSNGEKSTIFLGSGVDGSEFQLKGPFLQIKAGGVLPPAYLSKADDSIPLLIGEGLAAILKAKVGSELSLMSATSTGALNALDVVVVGIFSTGVPDLDKRQLYLPISAGQQLLQSDKISELNIYLLHDEQQDELAATLQTELTQTKVTPWQDRAFVFKAVRDLYNRIFGTLGILMLLLVLFAVGHGISQVVTERTREIGTMAALGERRSRIVGNFVLEALLLGAFSAVVATLSTLLCCELLRQFKVMMPPPPGSSQGYPLMISFSAELTLYAGLVLMVVCMLFALKASLSAARKPLVEALGFV
jgi:putative ABC transport system permease protein